MDISKKMQSWKCFDFGQKANKSSKNSTKSIFENPHNIKRNAHKKTEKVPKRFDFVAKLAPKQISDLAVHPKKLQELQGCLLDMFSTKSRDHPQILLVSGPSGSGKSTALKVICKEFGVGLNEWINPLDQDFEITHENQISQFLDFLVSSKWGSLFETTENHITVVKDFPNTIIRQPEQFYSVLENCWYKTKTSIAFICTEANNNNVNLIKKLFPDNIMKDYRVRHVEFNACAPTLMKNALKRAQALINDHPELFSQPSSTVIEAIVATSMGDIRNAMNQFHLSSLKGGGSVQVVVVANDKELIGTKRKKRNNNMDVKIACMERDETLGLFHGLGRVLNPKWTNEKLNCNIEKIVDEFSTQPGIFMSFLFENYLKYFGDLNDAVKAAEVLSLSIKFLDNFAEKHDILLYGLWVSIFGLMLCNKHKVSRWTQIKGPVRLEKKTVINEISLLGFDSFDMFYCNLIKSSKNCNKNLSEAFENGYDSDELIILDSD